MAWEMSAMQAEGVSAIAVVILLVFVALQVRETNAPSRVDTAHRINGAHSDVSSQITANRELAEISYTVTHDTVERVCCSTLLTAYRGVPKDANLQELAGLSPFGPGGADLVAMLAPQYTRLLRSTQVRRWWSTGARELFAPVFLPGFVRMSGSAWRPRNARNMATSLNRLADCAFPPYTLLNKPARVLISKLR